MHADLRDRDAGSIPGLGRSPRGGHGYPLQYSCLGNCMHRGAWWATVHGVAKSHTQLKWLSTYACLHPVDTTWWPGSGGWRDYNAGSHVTLIVFAGLPPPGHCRDSKLKYAPSFCERGLIFSPGSSALRTGFRLGTHLETYREALREYRPGTPFLCCLSGESLCYAQAGEVIHSLTHYRGSCPFQTRKPIWENLRVVWNGPSQYHPGMARVIALPTLEYGPQLTGRVGENTWKLYNPATLNWEVGEQSWWLPGQRKWPCAARELDIWVGESQGHKLRISVALKVLFPLCPGMENHSQPHL